MINTPGPIRYSLIATVILFYFTPILILSAYGVKFFPTSVSWVFLSAGLLLASIGSIFILLRITSWEGKVWNQIDHLADAKAEILFKNKWEAKEEELQVPSNVMVSQELQNANEQLKIERESYRQQEKQKQEIENECFEKLSAMKKELEKEHQSAEAVLEEKSKLIREYSETLSEMRKKLEEKNSRIAELEGAVSDLNYEIQTLVQVSTFENVESQVAVKKEIFEKPIQNMIPAPPYPIEKSTYTYQHPPINRSHKTLDDLATQLKRCLNIAQKMTGPSHFGLNPRFANMGIESLALEQRRFFDSLEIESLGVVLVYSQKEDRLLFVSESIREMTGWTSDKFTHEFFQLIPTTLNEWRKGLQTLTSQGEARMSLVLKTKQGHDQQVKCLMGSIPSGIFKHDVIAVFA